MKNFRTLICVLGTGMMLSACSYFDADKPDVTTAQPIPAEKVDLTTGQTITDQAQGPQQLAPIEFKDVAGAIKNSSAGSVEIFPLDDSDMPATSDTDGDGFSNSTNDITVEPVSAVPVYGQQSELNPYPGVEIFPLDDDMANELHTRQFPPANAGPMSLTPFPTAENTAGRGSDFVAVGTPGGPAVVYFERDSSVLSQNDLAEISNIAHNYGPGSVQDISVAGHASVQSSIKDPIQRKIINLKISMDRAFAVARALIESGIPPERIETKAYGEAKPPVPTNKPVEVASRRVEIFGVTVQ